VKLPNLERAQVSRAKVVDYLLNTIHPDGQTKARFFLRFGFSIDSWEAMAAALVQHAQEHDVTSVKTSSHGVEYVIEGELHTPDERNPSVRSVWIIDSGDDVPRVVTAYPIGRRAR
jgi:hypothetical protein